MGGFSLTTTVAYCIQTVEIPSVSSWLLCRLNPYIGVWDWGFCSERKGSFGSEILQNFAHESSNRKLMLWVVQCGLDRKKCLFSANYFWRRSWCQHYLVFLLAEASWSQWQKHVQLPSSRRKREMEVIICKIFFAKLIYTVITVINLLYCGLCDFYTDAALIGSCLGLIFLVLNFEAS